VNEWVTWKTTLGILQGICIGYVPYLFHHLCI
jgi:hypothetical protein